MGQTYHGPVVLITDALCYSTTDIFAAGFQDHDLGFVLGPRLNAAGRLTDMTVQSNADRAAAFLAQHLPGAGFVLPNAWDAGGAGIYAFARRGKDRADVVGCSIDRLDMAGTLARCCCAAASPARLGRG